MTLELMSVLVVLLLGLLPLMSRTRDRRAQWIVLAAGGLLGLGIVLFNSERLPALDAPPPKTQPTRALEDGYISSDGCRSCHPSEYASWEKTYHRSMTRPATPEYVFGDFDDTRLTLRDGRVYHLERRGDAFWASWEALDKTAIKRSEMIVGILQDSLKHRTQAPEVLAQMQRDLDAELKKLSHLNSTRIRFERPIVQVTGSHHQQIYWMPATLDTRDNRVEKINKGIYSLNWVPTDLQGELMPFPFSWIIKDKRWVRRGAVFLQPSPEPHPDEFGPWNDNCIKCHATHGRPNRDEAAAKTLSEVVEFGIGCESCHGPGGEHARVNQQPQRRYAMHLSGDDDAQDPTIAQPGKMAREPSSQVCGQCHSVGYFKNHDRYLSHGTPFRPGKTDLNDAKDIIHPRDAINPEVIDRLGLNLIESFWPDGVVRLLGREYNGVIDSACALRGEMKCTTCHQLHGSDPDDQLKPGMRGDTACVGCHQEYRDPERITAHTHHPVGSSGSACMNCHMPYTVFGLLKAARSHYIDIPSAVTSVEIGRPNGCNQCHVDKTLRWTADLLTEWYDAPQVKLDPDQEVTSATLLWLLRGDAAQRSLAAWTLGWDEARAVSGERFGAPILARLLNDPYAVTRHTIVEVLRKEPGFEDFEYDYVAPEAEREAAIQRAMTRWESLGEAKRTGRAILIHDDGGLMKDEVERLLLQRDDRPIILAE